jgi:hypothetical protein
MPTVQICGPIVIFCGRSRATENNIKSEYNVQNLIDGVMRIEVLHIKFV